MLPPPPLSICLGWNYLFPPILGRQSDGVVPKDQIRAAIFLPSLGTTLLDVHYDLDGSAPLVTDPLLGNSSLVQLVQLSAKPELYVAVTFKPIIRKVKSQTVFCTLQHS